MKHTKKITKYNGTHKELTTEIGDLYYDSLAELLDLLSDKIKNDGDADKQRGRVKLAHELHSCSDHLLEASKHIDKAWKICKPFMK